MTPYINPAFRDRQVRSVDGAPVALLPGTVEDSSPVRHGPGMSPEFRARGRAFIEAQAREVTPSPPQRARVSNRHAAFCVSLAFPVCFAIMAAAFGDLRLCAIFCLMGMFMALVGLWVLDGPA